MEFKSFYGSTIREALDAARRELGPDAAILASRQLDPEPGKPRQFEAVCGTVNMQELNHGVKTEHKSGGKFVKTAAPGAAVVKRIPATSVPSPAPAQPIAAPPVTEARPMPAKPKLQTGFSRLRGHVDTIRQVIAPESVKQDSRFDDLRQALLFDGFDSRLATEIIAGVKERVRDASFDAALTQELTARTQIDATLGRSASTRKITAFVGPPGVGKTSLLVKTAVRYGLTGRRPLRIISLDGARIGGTDALQTFAAAMAVSMDVVETGAALVQLLDTCPEAGLVLIDTPGLSPSDFAASQEIIRALALHPEIDVQLVVSGSTSASSLKATMSRFRSCMPAKIAVTQTDAAESSRAALGLALNYELPLSFFGTGPGIPEDLAEASVSLLLCGEGADRADGKRSAVSAA